MKIRWKVDTGYVDRIPPKEFEIPDEDLEDLDEWERDKIISERVLEEFQNRMRLNWEIVE